MGDTEHAFRAFIETGEIIPAFTLPGSDGMPYSPWMYKQQEHLLLLMIRLEAQEVKSPCGQIHIQAHQLHLVALALEHITAKYIC